jgi:hypothetical protein
VGEERRRGQRARKSGDRRVQREIKKDRSGLRAMGRGSLPKVKADSPGAKVREVSRGRRGSKMAGERARSRPMQSRVEVSPVKRVAGSRLPTRAEAVEEVNRE